MLVRPVHRPIPFQVISAGFGRVPHASGLARSADVVTQKWQVRKGPFPDLDARRREARSTPMNGHRRRVWEVSTSDSRNRNKSAFDCRVDRARHIGSRANPAVPRPSVASLHAAQAICRQLEATSNSRMQWYAATVFECRISTEDVWKRAALSLPPMRSRRSAVSPGRRRV